MEECSGGSGGGGDGGDDDIKLPDIHCCGFPFLTASFSPSNPFRFLFLFCSLPLYK